MDEPLVVSMVPLRLAKWVPCANDENVIKAAGERAQDWVRRDADRYGWQLDPARGERVIVSDVHADFFQCNMTCVVAEYNALLTPLQHAEYRLREAGKKVQRY